MHINISICTFLEHAQVHHSGEKTGLGETEADADANELRVPAAWLGYE